MIPDDAKYTKKEMARTNSNLPIVLNFITSKSEVLIS